MSKNNLVIEYFRKQNREVIFYDIETLEKNLLIVFKNFNNEVVYMFNNDFDKIEELRQFLQRKVLVGYNNYYYDDYILSAVLKKYTMSQIKKLNDVLINDRNNDISKNRNFIDGAIQSLDIMQAILESVSLKVLESRLGMSIEEYDNFDTSKELKDEELKILIKYCEHDVYSTIEVFKNKEIENFFIARLNLLEMNESSLIDKRNNTSLVTDIVYKEPLKEWLRLEVPENILNQVPQEVVEMWRNQEVDYLSALKRDEKISNKSNQSIKYYKDIEKNILNILDKAVKHKLSQAEIKAYKEDLKLIESKLNVETSKNEVVITEFDNEITFGLGGIHSANVNSKGRIFKNVRLLDVTSLYPHLIILLNILGDVGTKNYKAILEKRIELKKKAKLGDTDAAVEADTLKLILNSISGLLKQYYSKLYNPIANLSMTAMGQCLLYILSKRLYEAGAEIVQLNTDGVAFVMDSDKYLDIKSDWEKEFNLQLTIEEYDKFIQSDVNNYVGVEKEKDKYGNNKLKLKGSRVLQAKNIKLFKDNDAIITHVAMTEALVNEYKTIDEIREFIKSKTNETNLFHFTLKAGRTYSCVVDSDLNVLQKVNRVFATKDSNYCVFKTKNTTEELEKAKRTNNFSKISLEKFARISKNSKLYNKALADIDINKFKKEIDIEYYTYLTVDSISKWGFELEDIDEYLKEMSEKYEIVSDDFIERFKDKNKDNVIIENIEDDDEILSEDKEDEILSENTQAVNVSNTATLNVLSDISIDEDEILYENKEVVNVSNQATLNVLSDISIATADTEDEILYENTQAVNVSNQTTLNALNDISIDATNDININELELKDRLHHTLIDNLEDVDLTDIDCFVVQLWKDKQFLYSCRANNATAEEIIDDMKSKNRIYEGNFNNINSFSSYDDCVDLSKRLTEANIDNYITLSLSDKTYTEHDYKIFCVDLDIKEHYTEEENDYVRKVREEFLKCVGNAYVETSKSGTGTHIISLYKDELDFLDDYNTSYKNVEIFTKNRAINLTGRVICGQIKSYEPKLLETISKFVKNNFKKKKSATITKNKELFMIDDKHELALSDDVVQEIIMKKGTNTAKALYDENCLEQLMCKNGSRHCVDFIMLSSLAYYTRHNTIQMKRMFKNSDTFKSYYNNGYEKYEKDIDNAIDDIISKHKDIYKKDLIIKDDYCIYRNAKFKKEQAELFY